MKPRGASELTEKAVGPNVSSSHAKQSAVWALSFTPQALGSVHHLGRYVCTRSLVGPCPVTVLYVMLYACRLE